MGCNALAFGMQFLMDSQLNWLKAGTPIYLRLKNFPDIQDETYAELGFSIAPTGTVQVGTTDYIIDPWPSTVEVSLANVGRSMGKIRFGAREFMISETWVCAMAAVMGVGIFNVWKDPRVVGLVQDNLLFDIVSYTYEGISGVPVLWFLTCNANELK